VNILSADLWIKSLVEIEKNLKDKREKIWDRMSATSSIIAEINAITYLHRGWAKWFTNSQLTNTVEYEDLQKIEESLFNAIIILIETDKEVTKKYEDAKMTVITSDKGVFKWKRYQKDLREAMKHVQNKGQKESPKGIVS